MKIEVWSDYACPFCYIGKERLGTALEQFEHRQDIEVVYKSFELDPQAPREVDHDVHDMLSAKYGMSREQAIQMNRNLARQAEDTGLTFQFDTMKLTNTFDAHRLTQYAAQQGKMDKIAEELFRAYFTDSQHLGDHDTLLDLAERIGLDRQATAKMLEGDDFATQVRTDEDEARQLGITSVPFFVIDRKYAVSGAQSTDTFLQAVQKAWSESSRPLQVLGSEQPGTKDDAANCQDGSCSIE